MRRFAFALSFSLASLLVAAASAEAAEPGSLWQVETAMEMPGMNMKMPAQRHEVCSPKSAEGPESLAGGDSECTMSNVQRSPGKFSFDVQCPDGQGHGEMSFEGQNAYTSTMTITADGQTMKMVTHGRRIGDCDASAAKRQAAAIQSQAQAQADQGMAQMCGSMADALLPGSLETARCGPQYKDALCKKFATRPGFGEVAGRQPTGQAVLDSGTLPEVARFCGVDGEGLRVKLCGEASRGEDLDFLGRACPEQGRAIAQRECAGRSFSSPPAERYREFCANYAREMMQGSGRAQAAPGDAGSSGSGAGSSAPGRAVEEGAKKLKGLLGF
ncbi:MAG: DUF3617 family protein [Myxococcota bacterium]